MAEVPLTEEEVKELVRSLKDLNEVLSGLKESGMLGLLKTLSEKSGDVFLSVASDPALMRSVAILASLLYGVSQAEADKLNQAQVNIAEITKALVDALGSIDMENINKVGLWGLMGALGDPDVQYGLGLLIALAKELGKRLRK